MASRAAKLALNIIRKFSPPGPVPSEIAAYAAHAQRIQLSHLSERDHSCDNSSVRTNLIQKNKVDPHFSTGAEMLKNLMRKASDEISLFISNEKIKNKFQKSEV